MRKLLLVGLMLLMSITAFSQISGKVFDVETNDPLPGATISATTIKGKIGVSTGFDGTFTFDILDGELITISYLGYVGIV